MVFGQIRAQLLRLLKHSASQSNFLSSTAQSTAACSSWTIQPPILLKLQYAVLGVKPACLLLSLCGNLLNLENRTGGSGGVESSESETHDIAFRAD